MARRVAVDATALLGHRTGIGVFTHELITGLQRRDDVDPVAFAMTWRGRDRLAHVVPPRVTTVRRPLPARPSRVAWRRGDRPRIERWTGPIDLVHGPNFVVPPSDAPQVLTVHDLTAVRFPELCERDVLAYPALIRAALRRGAWIHTVSEFVGEEVRACFRTDRVVPVPNGVTPVPDARPERGHELAGSPRYVLAVGTVEPRKDLPVLVDAFAAPAATDPDLRLVLAGPDGWGRAGLDAAVARSPVADRIVRTGWVDDGERAALLRGASTLAYPSRYEGFGLPPLEAMSVGVPVVCSDAGALPETVGDAAVVVPVGDVDALADGLGTVLTDRQRREHLVRRGRDRAAAYSWDRCVEGILGLYERLWAVHSPT